MNNNILRAFKNQWISELNAFTDYIEHSKKSIANTQNNFEQKLKTLDDGQNPKIIITTEQWEEHSKLNSIFPHFFRLSTFVGLQFAFENKLSLLCSRIHDTGKYKIKVSDFRGENIIEKSRLYLTLVIGIDFNSINEEWVKITDFIKLRNNIVHNNSRVFKNKENLLPKEKELCSIVKKYPSLRVEDYGLFYIIDDIFLSDFIEVQKKYLSAILDKLDLVIL